MKYNSKRDYLIYEKTDLAAVMHLEKILLNIYKQRGNFTTFL